MRCAGCGLCYASPNDGQGRVQRCGRLGLPLTNSEQTAPAGQSAFEMHWPTKKFASRHAMPLLEDPTQVQFVHSSEQPVEQGLKQPPFWQSRPPVQSLSDVHSAVPSVWASQIPQRPPRHSRPSTQSSALEQVVRQAPSPHSYGAQLTTFDPPPMQNPAPSQASAGVWKPP